MASKFISVSIEDFEAQFNVPNKKKPGERAFFLNSPQGQEAFYACKLKESKAGELWLKVYTSVKSGGTVARSCGDDAIRICMVWQDSNGWQAPVGEKPARVYRAGGKNATAKDVVKRAFDRAKEVAIEGVRVAPTCDRCGRPMCLKAGKHGEFWGCVGFGSNRANCFGTKEISK